MKWMIAMLGAATLVACGSEKKAQKGDETPPTSERPDGEASPPADPMVMACDGGKAKSCMVVAESHESKGEFETAAEFYGEACELGEAAGCLFAGGALLEVDGRREEGLTYLEKSCESGEPSGCYGAGLVYQGVYDDGLANADRAKQRYRTACKQELAVACGQLGMLLVQSSSQSEQRQGLDYLEQGCQGGDADSCYSLGSMNAGAGNAEAADALIDRACKLEPDRCDWFRQNVESK